VTEAVHPPAHRVAMTEADGGGWTLMLVPATICLVMFVDAF